MYIRWRKRERRLPKNPLAWCDVWRDEHGSWSDKTPPEVLWSAVVVRPRRIDGQPRPQYIAYLGGITQSQILAEQSFKFWWKVQIGLDGLNLTKRNRGRLELAIAQKVPHPNKGKRFLNWEHVIAAEKVWVEAFDKRRREKMNREYIAKGLPPPWPLT